MRRIACFPFGNRKYFINLLGFRIFSNSDSAGCCLQSFGIRLSNYWLKRLFGELCHPQISVDAARAPRTGIELSRNDCRRFTIMSLYLSLNSVCFGPIRADADFGHKGNFEADDVFHDFFEQTAHLFHLIVRHFKDQFVMDLQQHTAF